MRARVTALSLFALAAASVDAHAGGLGRPTPFGARAFGMGGAMVAVANDPSALHYNPAGLTLQADDNLLIGAASIFADRQYTPQREGEPEGEPQDISGTPAFLPTLGYSTRLEYRGIPSRLALGIGVWNTYGGSARWPKMEDQSIRALNTTVSVVVEIVPGLAYEVNDWLSLGFGFRIGVGILSIDSTKNPSDAVFSGTGLGAGATFGVLLRPGEDLNLGLTYRTSMTPKIKGDGYAIITGDNQTDVEVHMDQKWPQSVSVGAAYQVTESLQLATQLDWQDWSRVQTITIDLRPVLERIEPTDFDDSVAIHVGAELAANDAIDLRAGYTYDTNAIPDRTMARQYLTGPSHAIGLGGGFDLGPKWVLDVGLEYIIPASRTVEDNFDVYSEANWSERANLWPGEFKSTVYTLEVDGQYRF